MILSRNLSQEHKICSVVSPLLWGASEKKHHQRNLVSLSWCDVCHNPAATVKESYLSCQSMSKENWRENEMFICPQKMHCAVTSVQGAQGSVTGGEVFWDGEGWWEQGWGQGAGGEAETPSSQVPTSPHSPGPTVRKIPIPDSGTGFLHLPRKWSHSEVVGEEILVEGEVISFKLQGFSSWGFQVASAQHFTVFLGKTLECLTTIYLKSATGSGKEDGFLLNRRGQQQYKQWHVSVFTGSL